MHASRRFELLGSVPGETCLSLASVAALRRTKASDRYAVFVMSCIGLTTKLPVGLSPGGPKRALRKHASQRCENAGLKTRVARTAFRRVFASALRLSCGYNCLGCSELILNHCRDYGVADYGLVSARVEGNGNRFGRKGSFSGVFTAPLVILVFSFPAVCAGLDRAGLRAS